MLYSKTYTISKEKFRAFIFKNEFVSRRGERVFSVNKKRNKKKKWKKHINGHFRKGEIQMFSKNAS